jgi:protocatechuate 3,4-dioxygenase beta subunit
MAGDRTAGARGGAWLSAALLSLALLVVPLAVWLFLPGPAPFVPPRRELAAAAPPVSSPAPAPAATAPHDVAALALPPERPAVAAEPVRGVVLDADGHPLAGASVACDEQHLTASADEGGRFELPPEADGCTAVATHPPHGVSEPTRLSAGRDNVLRLVGGGAVAGNVVDEGGKPVEAYLLAVESFVPKGGEARPSTAGRARKVFEPDGAFLWEDLAPGRYVLTASAAGRPPARSQAVEVEPGRTTHHVRIVLPRGVMLTGRIVDAGSREPIVNAQIELDGVTSSRANAISLVLTDGTGNYELEGAPASGPFSVRVSHERYMTKIVPGLDARGASSLRADVELRALGDGGPREELTGVGATLVPSPKGIVIASVIEGAPAARAGLTAGDRIVQIDGKDAADLGLAECLQRLRGQAGTRVSVGIDRAGQMLEFTLLRETVVH